MKSNQISVFYHGLGHTVIYAVQRPIFGQVYDAADQFSIFLIDEKFDPKSAKIIA